MPKRTDLHCILIIGSGPIVIGQGCEFDYSGVQACRALREEGYRIVLINSNPATIMTDPEFADATYIEPITPGAVEKILAYEKANGTPVDAVLPTLGGQTGLNTAMACYDQGIFAKYGVQMIGANRDAIHRGEDRKVFKDLMIQIGLKVPDSGVVHNLTDARQVLEEIGLPLIIRPAFTLGGTGGGIAYNVEEFETIVAGGPRRQPRHGGAHRAVRDRLERVRNGGDARPGRQRRHHLLHRERRPHGRPHRRQHHRRPDPDADRQRVPADAGRQHRRHPRRRRRRPAAATSSSPSTPTPAT